MGIEVSLQPLHPDNPRDKHSSRRIFSRDGEPFMTYDVHKGAYREAPKGFTVTWLSRKSNVDIAKSAVEFHLRARRRFGIPQDTVSVDLVKQIRNAALLTAWTALERSSDDSVLLALNRNPEKIEPVVVIRKVGSEGRVKRTFGAPRIGLSRLDYMARVTADFVSRLPNGPGLVEAQILSPFGTITFGGGLPGKERTITFEGRLKIIDPITSLVINSAGIEGLSQDEVNEMNDKFKKPITELPNPYEAGNHK